MRFLAVIIMLVAASANAMPLCGSGRRVNCVVDGDTFWLAGEKVRIVNIDAPEMQAECPSELALAQRAPARLAG
jgi:endonuclease YncB( thermonuclease family)